MKYCFFKAIKKPLTFSGKGLFACICLPVLLIGKAKGLYFFSLYLLGMRKAFVNFIDCKHTEGKA